MCGLEPCSGLGGRGFTSMPCLDCARGSMDICARMTAVFIYEKIIEVIRGVESYCGFDVRTGGYDVRVYTTTNVKAK
jgi:hypothetical protein